MWLSIAVLVLCAVLAVIGYRAMIDVKPRVPRPILDEAARAAVRALEGPLMAHVRMLAEEIGERNLDRPRELQAAADYIRRVWTGQGWHVREEEYAVRGWRSLNLLVEQRGSRRPDEILLIGAHYDSVLGSPGANDNGTGVAVLLELGRAIQAAAPARTVRLVAFVNEEPPYFFSDQMGSRVHARAARQRNEKIVGMVSLETLGYYAERAGSQSYPPPFSFFYPRQGNFLAVVGNLASRRLVVDLLSAFMAESDFPVEGVATFEYIPGINWSDHWSFWKEGYPALMLTDTAPFRYPEYHSLLDLPDQITAPEFARAAHGIIRTVLRLAAAP